MSSEATNSSGNEYAIEVNGLGKCYQIYDKPSDRLKQMLMRGRKQYYKEFWALKDVSFKIKKGETVGIIGRNGSGKSTLLQMICGTLNPTAGEVKVNGRVAALLELGAGFNPEFSGVENVYMAASLYGLSKEEVDQRFEAIAAFADIGDHIHQPVKTYSSGMYVRLAFAVIAHVDADILVVDEALAVGDAFFTQKCMRFLDLFMKRGSLIFVSHDMASVRGLCKAVIWLEAGKIHRYGDPKKVGDEYLENIYGARQNTNRTFIKDDKNNKIIIATDFLQEDVRLQAAINPLRYSPVPNLQLAGFGEGGASIVSVVICNELGETLRQSEGGRIVILRIEAKMHENLDNLIFGYFVRNRLGLNIFGDNTYLKFADSPPSGSRDEIIAAEFSFVMPFLPKGEYSVCAALATGSNKQHIQQHWVNDALFIQSIDNHVHADLLALPSLSMHVERI